MSTVRIFVVRVVRRAGSPEVFGSVENAATRKRTRFSAPEALWRVIAGPATRLPRAHAGDTRAAAGASSETEIIDAME